jgi:hypothetical protein
MDSWSLPGFVTQGAYRTSRQAKPVMLDISPMACPSPESLEHFMMKGQPTVPWVFHSTWTTYIIKIHLALPRHP